MTFNDWQNTTEGEEYFSKALEMVKNGYGTYIDDLMWVEYKASEHWQYDQYSQYKNDTKERNE